MDFLDPKNKKAYNIRLSLAYVLMVAIILLGTIILVYNSFGYSINRKTGNIIQNGLLFIDSRPSGAEILINGTTTNAFTAERLVLPAGEIDLALKRDGYSDWARKISLTESGIERFAYPRLFPARPEVRSVKEYPSNVLFLTQSPDRKWLMVADPSEELLTFDVYDTNKPDLAPTKIELPQALIPDYSASTSSISEVEWASDNNHLLISVATPSLKHFIIVNRENPAASVSVNSLFKTNPSQVALRDKKIAQLYFLDSATGTLSVANTSAGSLNPPFLTQVLEFKPFGNKQLSYITNKNAPAGKVFANIWDSGDQYTVELLPEAGKYLLNMASYEGASYFVAASSASTLVQIFKNPLSGLKDQGVKKALPFVALRSIANPASLSFSKNARFIGVQSGANFTSYDLETLRAHRFSLEPEAASEFSWLDGHRFIGKTSEKLTIIDYDGLNKYNSLATTSSKGGFISRDENLLFFLNPSAGGVSLQYSDTRAGADFPKN